MDTALASPASRLVTLPQGVPDLTLGWEAVRWSAKYLRHPNGPHAGQRWQFVDTQVHFLLWWYALDEDGRWLFHHGVRRLAKGSGKSPFAALLALVELCAPVRLFDFDPRAPGGCVGQPVAMPLVQIAATAESQTANTMRMVRALAPKGSRVVQDHMLDPGKTRYYKAPEGTLEVITSSSAAAEGAEASFIVGDETEHWKPGNGGPELAATLEDNLTKSGNRMLETCNAWHPGTGSVAEASYDGWVAQEEGRTRGKTKVLYDARIASPDTDLRDEHSLRRALEHVYDDCWWQQLRPIMERIWDPRSKEDDSRRKYLNQPTSPANSWTTVQAWGALRKPERVVAAGEDIVIFTDGSKSNDATAHVGCCMRDGHVFLIGAWEPDPNDDDDQVPLDEVDAVLAAAYDRYNVVAHYSDVRELESFVFTSWPEAYKDQLLLWAVPTGKSAQPIAWDMRSHGFDFTIACETAATEIDEGGFTHDDNPVLTRHVLNCRNRRGRWGLSVSKESPASPNKIDAGVCMVGARMVYRRVLASEEWQKRSRKKSPPRRIR